MKDKIIEILSEWLPYTPSTNEHIAQEIEDMYYILDYDKTLADNIHTVLVPAGVGGGALVFSRGTPEEIAKRLYEKWEQERFVDHFGLYEPFKDWLDGRE